MNCTSRNSRKWGVRPLGAFVSRGSPSGMYRDTPFWIREESLRKAGNLRLSKENIEKESRFWPNLAEREGHAQAWELVTLRGDSDVEGNYLREKGKSIRSSGSKPSASCARELSSGWAFSRNRWFGEAFQEGAFFDREVARDSAYGEVLAEEGLILTEATASALPEEGRESTRRDYVME